MSRPMGLGELGSQTVALKRKFRYTFEVNDICGGNIPASFVKLASRPNYTVEETQIDFLNGRTWIPGKISWETINVTYYDVATNANVNLWKWLASVYDFNDAIQSNQATVRGGPNRPGYAGTGILTMYDGCGNTIEIWTLSDVWPTSINFGDLDYSNSETADIELTLRYSQVNYQSLVPGMQDLTGCCTPFNLTTN